MRRWLSALLAIFVLFPALAESPNAAGPTFKIDDANLSSPPVFIIYGDTRFTRWPFPRNASSPWARQALVRKIASEKPDAAFIGGDLVFQGARMGDYEVFQQETRIWKDAHLRLFPVLGNHEFYDREFLPRQQRALQNWWTVFPFLKELRWYSVQVGAQVYVLCLDSNFGALRPGAPQWIWVEHQLSHLPESIKYVFFVLHHAPIGDYLEGHATHRNAPASASNLDEYLERKQPDFRARFIVVSGHIHNYARCEYNGVVEIVSGDGGAHPVFFRRQPDDKFKDKDLTVDGQALPNYHYVRFELRSDTLKAAMVRISNPRAGTGHANWDTPDKFVITPGNEPTAAAGKEASLFRRLLFAELLHQRVHRILFLLILLTLLVRRLPLCIAEKTADNSARSFLPRHGSN
jgi:acid phosphatase type 7